MTAPGGNLLTWLYRAIREREDAARHADKELGRTWNAGWNVHADSFDLMTDTGHMVATGLLPGCSSHATLNDPASVLRRCARDRKLLELHAAQGHSCPSHDYDGDLDSFARFYNHETCPVVQLLAEGYGWTEG